MAPSRSQLLETVNSMFANANKGTLEATLADRSPTCLWEIRPAELGTPKPLSNQEYVEWLDKFAKPLFKNMSIALDETKKPVVDEQTRNVVVYAKSKADTVVGPYEGKYIFQIEMSEDGKKIDYVTENLDSASAGALVQKFMAYQKEQQQ